MHNTLRRSARAVLLVLVFVTLIVGLVGGRLAVRTGTALCTGASLGGNISIEPRNGIYYNMSKILPFPVLLIFHSPAMTFVANVSGCPGVTRVEFFINGVLQYTATSGPFEWTLTRGSSKFWKFTLSVDDGNENASVVVRWINL